MEHETLKQLESYLLEDDLDTMLMEATEEEPAALLVYFGMETPERQTLLRITCYPEELFGGIQKEKEGYFLGAEKIEFRLDFPFAVHDETAHDVRSLVSFINRLIELPGLEVDEVENRVYYRYVWLCYRDAENLKLAQRIVGAVFMILQAFGAILESVAEGWQSLDELLEQVVAASQAAMSTSAEEV